MYITYTNYIYVYIYIYIWCVYIYIYIQREREREHACNNVYNNNICTYIYINVYRRAGLPGWRTSNSSCRMSFSARQQWPEPSGGVDFLAASYQARPHPLPLLAALTSPTLLSFMWLPHSYTCISLSLSLSLYIYIYIYIYTHTNTYISYIVIY